MNKNKKNSITKSPVKKEAKIESKEAQEIYLQHRDEIYRCVRSVTHDVYQLLLSLNLFDKQDDAAAQAYYSEPLLPLVAQYIRNHIEHL